MTCLETEPLIGASLDGELDPITALKIDQHVSSCGACSVRLARLELLRDEIAAAGLDYGAAADLRPLAAAIRHRSGGRSAWWRTPWLPASLAGALAAAALLIVALPQGSSGTSDRQVVDNHLRSLLANHLVDVPSSDHHTVKPWFQGKLDFSPPVPELAADGFVLIGGRLDVIDGKQAAALVYGRRKHVVNLWIAPANGSGRGMESSTIEGFHVLRWQADRLRYWAVSDLDPVELRKFAELIRAR